MNKDVKRMTKSEKNEAYQSRGQIDLALLKRYHEHADQQAYEELFSRQEASVKYIAKKHLPWKNGCEWHDLVQQGYLGVATAIKKFDLTKKVPFNYYSNLWVEAAITGYIWKNGRTVRPSVSLSRKAKKLITLQSKMEHELGREPTDMELSEKSGHTLQQMTKIRVNGQVKVSSIDTPVSSEGNATFGDLMPCQRKDPSQDFEQSDMIDAYLNVSAKVLTDKEQKIMKMRFPLDGAVRMTLDQIADNLGMTKMGICSAEKRILKKLRTELKSQNIEG